jgi:ribonuclease Z
MKLQFLGTGAGVPSRGRNVTSIILNMMNERKSIWMFDCGEATQHQILQTTIKPRRIEKIFITHLHGDHIFGLPGLLSSRSFQGGSEKVTLYGPIGLRNFIEVTLAVSASRLQYPIDIIEIEEGGVIFEDDQLLVEAGLLEHGIPSYGFRVIEKDRPGELLVDRLEAEGIQAGPLYKQIKEGGMVELPNERMINGADFVGPTQKGRIVAILGDTRPCENADNLSLHADVLVHEATFNATASEMANQYFHSTTEQAATTAKRSSVKQLILTHISSRYNREDVFLLKKEAEQIHPSVQIAEDFFEWEIEVPKIV